MLAAVQAHEWGALGTIFVLVVVLVLVVYGRHRDYRRVRFGIFVERERFDDEDDVDGPVARDEWVTPPDGEQPAPTVERKRFPGRRDWPS